MKKIDRVKSSIRHDLHRWNDFVIPRVEAFFNPGGFSTGSLGELRVNHTMQIRSALALYKDTIADLARFLREMGDDAWLSVLSQWLEELEAIEEAGDRAALCSHAHRSWFATGGMGSLGDLTIGLHNGHIVTDVSEANEKWGELIAALFRASEMLSLDLGCPKLSRTNRPNMALKPD